jgi:hypothetical protein
LAETFLFENNSFYHEEYYDYKPMYFNSLATISDAILSNKKKNNFSKKKKFFKISI